MNGDINRGFDIAEIERWLFNYFRIGMTKVGGFPVLPGDDPPDRNDLFWRC